MEIEILHKFETATGELLTLLSSLNQEQINRKNGDGWTAGQVGEHLLRSYGAVETLNGSVEETRRAPDEKIGEVRDLFLDFTIKMKSPEGIVPSNDRIDRELLLNKLKKRISQFKETILHKDLTATCTDHPFPGSGNFTRLEWILFTIVHTQRHLRQLKQIIAGLSKA